MVGLNRRFTGGTIWILSRLVRPEVLRLDHPATSYAPATQNPPGPRPEAFLAAGRNFSEMQLGLSPEWHSDQRVPPTDTPAARNPLTGPILLAPWHVTKR